LREINPAVEIIVVPSHPTVDLARQWAATAHVVISAAPLFEERHALHDAAAHHGLPCVEAAMFQMEGYVTVVQPPLTASYRDWCPAQPAWWRRRFPVFGAVAGTIGSLAAVETLKLLTGIGRPLHGRLTHIDFASGRCREVKLPGPPAHGAGSERYPQIPDGSVSEQGGADCSALAHVEPMSGGNPLPIVSDILTSAGKSPTDRENA
jgi:molybdopterin/thiamine biosynthesis adenylyltransferase